MKVRIMSDSMSPFRNNTGEYCEKTTSKSEAVSETHRYDECQAAGHPWCFIDFSIGYYGKTDLFGHYKGEYL